MDKWGNSSLGRYSFGATQDLSDTSILIVVGSLSISGGTNLIFEYANAIQNSGANVTIAYLLGEAGDANWHPHSSKFTYEKITSVYDQYFDLVIVTWWKSVYELENLRFSRVLYFVQSLETRFALNYGDIYDEALAAATYTVGLPMVVVASWLQNLLISTSGKPAWFLPNGIDETLFPYDPRSRNRNSNPRLRVLVEGVPGIPMKAVDETLELCAEIPGVELWHVTPQPGTGSPIAARTFERVTISEMSEIYSQVDVLVKLSRVEGMFAPPLEAFRSGATAIVSKVTGYDEYITNGENALVVEVDDFDSARESIIELRDNQILLNKLQAKALETSKEWPSIRETGQKFVTICATVLAMRENQQECKRELRAARKHVNGAFRHREDPRSAYPPQLFVNSPRT